MSLDESKIPINYYIIRLTIKLPLHKNYRSFTLIANRMECCNVESRTGGSVSVRSHRDFASVLAAWAAAL